MVTTARKTISSLWHDDATLTLTPAVIVDDSDRDDDGDTVAKGQPVEVSLAELVAYMQAELDFT